MRGFVNSAKDVPCHMNAQGNRVERMLIFAMEMNCIVKSWGISTREKSPGLVCGNRVWGQMEKLLRK